MQLWKGQRRVYVTADTHFADPVVPAKFGRPFATLEAMDDALVAAVNARVGAKDTLLHLGDFAGERTWSKAEKRRIGEIRDRIACRRIVLVHGNLDPIGERWFDGMFDSIETSLTWKGWPGSSDSLRVVACHYPLRQWQGWPHGAVHLYGHVHGTLPEEGRSTDVGVDCWSYAPIELVPLLDSLARRPFAAPATWPRRQGNADPDLLAAERDRRQP